MGGHEAECRNCRFWEGPAGHDDETGECHRYPPRHDPVSHAACVREDLADAADDAEAEGREHEDDESGRALRNARRSWAWAFPVVNCHDWCGEFAPGPDPKGGA